MHSGICLNNRPVPYSEVTPPSLKMIHLTNKCDIQWNADATTPTAAGGKQYKLHIWAWFSDVRSAYGGSFNLYSSASGWLVRVAYVIAMCGFTDLRR